MHFESGEVSPAASGKRRALRHQPRDQLPSRTLPDPLTFEDERTHHRTTAMALRIDFTNMMAEVVAGGIESAAWTAAKKDFTKAHAGLEKRRKAGELGFLDL